MPEVIGLFSIPTEDHLNYKSEIESIMDSAPKELRCTNYRSDNLEHICNSRYQNIFKQFPSLKKLEESLRDYCVEYINKSGFICDQVVITDAWLNRAGLNAQQHSHLHYNSYLSGTYYINFDSQKHSQIIFYNQRLLNAAIHSPVIEIPVNTNQPTPFNSKEISINCKEGQVLIWKSHLNHGYKKNMVDNRLTMSFNVMPKVCTDGSTYSFSINDDNSL